MTILEHLKMIADNVEYVKECDSINWDVDSLKNMSLLVPLAIDYIEKGNQEDRWVLISAYNFCAKRHRIAESFYFFKMIHDYKVPFTWNV